MLNCISVSSRGPATWIAPFHMLLGCYPPPCLLDQPRGTARGRGEEGFPLPACSWAPCSPRCSNPAHTSLPGSASACSLAAAPCLPPSATAQQLSMGRGGKRSREAKELPGNHRGCADPFQAHWELPGPPTPIPWLSGCSPPTQSPLPMAVPSPGRSYRAAIGPSKGSLVGKGAWEQTGRVNPHSLLLSTSPSASQMEPVAQFQPHYLLPTATAHLLLRRAGGQPWGHGRGSMGLI